MHDINLARSMGGRTIRTYITTEEMDMNFFTNLALLKAYAAMGETSRKPPVKSCPDTLRREQPELTMQVRCERAGQTAVTLIVCVSRAGTHVQG